MKIKLMILITIYSIAGAYMFMWLEVRFSFSNYFEVDNKSPISQVPTDLAAKEEAYHARMVARENMYLT